MVKNYIRKILKDFLFVLPAIKLMRSILQHNVHQWGFGKRYEAKTSGPTRLAVLHHNAVDNVPVAGEITLQVLLGGLPWQSTNEQFSVTNKNG